MNRYNNKAYALFQRLDGIDVFLFLMYVQEFATGAGGPNAGRACISYLDSGLVCAAFMFTLPIALSPTLQGRKLCHIVGAGDTPTVVVAKQLIRHRGQQHNRCFRNSLDPQREGFPKDGFFESSTRSKIRRMCRKYTFSVVVRGGLLSCGSNAVLRTSMQWILARNSKADAAAGSSVRSSTCSLT